MPATQQQPNGWNEWSRHVLAELERHNSLLMGLDEKLNAIRIELTTLKIKAGLWGMLAGAVPAIAVVIYEAATRIK